MKIIAIIILLVLPSQILANLSKITKSDWLFLQKYCKDFLEDNRENIEIYTNESGFYRVKISCPANYKRDIITIRINYWAEDSSKMLMAENIHNHPNYFESKIIKGWYKHELFNVSKIKNVNSHFISYSIDNTDPFNKKIIAQKSVYLHSKAIEKVLENDIINIDTNLIHRITIFKPGTLSINVTFKNHGQINHIYDVFFTQHSKPEENTNTRIKIYNQKDRDYLTNSMIAILSNNVTN
jgi:hypothetical protein